MTLLILKLLLTPTLIAAASLAGRKWGHTISGWIVALPLTTAPVAFLLTLQHDTQFAADTSAAILAGGFSQAAFVTAYAHTARRFRWPFALVAGTGAFVLLTIILQQVHIDLFLLWLLVMAGFVLALGVLPAYPPSTPEDTSLPGTWDIPLRMAVATAYVVFLTGFSEHMGSRLTGLLAPFPLFTAVLAAFSQHTHGPAAPMKLFRGLLMGLFGYASFNFTLSYMITRVHPWGWAFVVAIGSIGVVQGFTLWLLRRHILRNGI